MFNMTDPYETAQAHIKDIDEVLKLFRSPKRWTKDTLARDDEGKPISPLHSDAVSFCLVGAFARVSHMVNEVPDQLLEAVRSDEKMARAALISGNDYISVSGFNDLPSTTIQDVRKVLRRAQKLLREVTP